MDSNIFISVEDASKIIGCNPQSIRYQAHDDPGKLGFKVTVLGKRIMIPRKPFYDYLGINGEAQ